MMTIQPLTDLNNDVLQKLLTNSLDEGYTFVQTLLDQYLSGKVTFTEDESLLLSAKSDDELIGVGGIHPDPYLIDSSIGRIRHVYVLPEYRRSGIGRQLVESLLEHARRHYSSVTLRTLTTHGDAFYKSLGFSDTARFDQATHWIEITQRG